MLFTLHSLNSTFWKPLFQTRFRESDVGHRGVNTLELAFVHFKVVKQATTEPCTPFVGSQESALFMQMHVAGMTCLYLLPLMLY